LAGRGLQWPGVSAAEAVDQRHKINKSITLPSYVADVAKVQMWCAWAEMLLGEAPFDSSLKPTD